jgi:hypothetical protein
LRKRLFLYIAHPIPAHKGTKMEDYAIKTALEGISEKVNAPINELRYELKAVELELADMKANGHTRGGASSGPSVGELVAKEFAKNEESFRKHKTLSMEVSTKGITAGLVGQRSSIAPTGGGDLQVQTRLINNLPMRKASGIAALVYARRSIGTLGGTTAAAVAENALRPKSEPVYTSITQNLCTLAGYAELSETALRTETELQSVIDLHLTGDLYRAGDALLIGGGVNFVGGLLALATPDVLPIATTNPLLEESIAIEVLTMQALGYRPDIVCVNPTDWRAVFLRRDTAGMYVHSFGSPMGSAPLLISGCKVVFNSAVATQTAIVLDSRYVDFQPIETMRLELAYVASQFLTGEVTVRAELQGLPVLRDLAACKLVSRA